MDFLDYDGVSITIKLTTLQCIVVLPNSHSIDKTTCDPACSKTVSDEDDSADVQHLLCPELSEELVGLTQHVFAFLCPMPYKQASAGYYKLLKKL